MSVVEETKDELVEKIRKNEVAIRESSDSEMFKILSEKDNLLRKQLVLLKEDETKKAAKKEREEVTQSDDCTAEYSQLTRNNLSNSCWPRLPLWMNPQLQV